MSLRSQISSTFTEVAKEQHKKLAPLTDDLALLDSGVDSLCLAVIVARLEEQLRIDPFSTAEDIEVPTTFGQFVTLYERAVS